MIIRSLKKIRKVENMRVCKLCEMCANSIQTQIKHVNTNTSKLMVHECAKVKNSCKIKKLNKARLRVARMCADSIKTRVKLGARKCKAREFGAKIKIKHARLRVAQNVRGLNTKK